MVLNEKKISKNDSPLDFSELFKMTHKKKISHSNEMLGAFSSSLDLHFCKFSSNGWKHSNKHETSIVFLSSVTS